MTNSPSFLSSENIFFISFSFLEDIEFWLTGFFPSPLKICHFFPSWFLHYCEWKTTVIKTGIPLWVMYHFSLAIYKIFFVVFSFHKFHYWCGILWIHPIWDFLSILNLQIYVLSQIWEVSAIMPSNIPSVLFFVLRIWWCKY